MQGLGIMRHGFPMPFYITEKHMGLPIALSIEENGQASPIEGYVWFKGDCLPVGFKRDGPQPSNPDLQLITDNDGNSAHGIALAEDEYNYPRPHYLLSDERYYPLAYSDDGQPQEGFLRHPQIPNILLPVGLQLTSSLDNQPIPGMVATMHGEHTAGVAVHPTAGWSTHYVGGELPETCVDPRQLGSEGKSPQQERQQSSSEESHEAAVVLDAEAAGSGDHRPQNPIGMSYPGAQSKNTSNASGHRQVDSLTAPQSSLLVEQPQSIPLTPQVHSVSVAPAVVSLTNPAPGNLRSMPSEEPEQLINAEAPSPDKAPLMPSTVDIDAARVGNPLYVSNLDSGMLKTYAPMPPNVLPSSSTVYNSQRPLGDYGSYTPNATAAYMANRTFELPSVTRYVDPTSPYTMRSAPYNNDQVISGYQREQRQQYLEPVEANVDRRPNQVYTVHDNNSFGNQYSYIKNSNPWDRQREYTCPPTYVPISSQPMMAYQTERGLEYCQRPDQTSVVSGNQCSVTHVQAPMTRTLSSAVDSRMYSGAAPGGNVNITPSETMVTPSVSMAPNVLVGPTILPQAPAAVISSDMQVMKPAGVTTTTSHTTGVSPSSHGSRVVRVTKDGPTTSTTTTYGTVTEMPRPIESRVEYEMAVSPLAPTYIRQQLSAPAPANHRLTYNNIMPREVSLVREQTAQSNHIEGEAGNSNVVLSRGSEPLAVPPAAVRDSVETSKVKQGGGWNLFCFCTQGKKQAIQSRAPAPVRGRAASITSESSGSTYTASSEEPPYLKTGVDSYHTVEEQQTPTAVRRVDVRSKRVGRIC